ncbi:hypothetical protein [Pseudonocardia sp. N23]|uniref:hypothetical protein n=1 Tax=Pseudonocardia sp. N23 TaxID=1987376 RepID=UPI000BFBB638|nr:hypothetical protein [Pseudonocardia sp. N23]GAY07309.1 hypothetical protein TOK_2534 [Pseudonocardia sp. N23]
MRVVIVCESCFGNTGSIASAVADGLRDAVPDADVSVLDVSGASPDAAAAADLLVVAAPTHTFGLSRPGSRRAAQQMGATITPSVTGMREWLGSLARTDVGGHVAALDTRLSSALLWGSAARAMMRRLRSLGGTSLAPPETFWLRDMAGPPLDAEQSRARLWGAMLGERLVSATPVR